MDDGSGRCVPGSELSPTDSTEGSEGEEIEVEEPEVEEPEVEEPEEEEPEEEEPEEEEPEGLRVWIYDTSPQNNLELCEGDFIAALGMRRSDAAGELRGSVFLVDPEMAELEETELPGGYTLIQGEFRFADGEDQITVYDLDQKRIGRCPKCNELRNVRLGIEIGTVGDPDKTYEIGDELVFRIRKATDERCQPK